MFDPSQKLHEDPNFSIQNDWCAIGVRLVCDWSAFLELGFGDCEYYYTELGYLGSEYFNSIIG